MTIDTSFRHVIYNHSWKSEGFRASVEKHLGPSHVIRERELHAEHEGVEWSNEFVGFGDESVWRGRFFYKGDRLEAIELVSNCDRTPHEISLATLGLAVLTHNKGCVITDVVVLG